MFIFLMVRAGESLAASPAEILYNTDRTLGYDLGDLTWDLRVERPGQNDLLLEVLSNNNTENVKAVMNFKEDKAQTQRRFIVADGKLWFFREGLRKPVPLIGIAQLNGPATIVPVLTQSFSRDYEFNKQQSRPECKQEILLKAKSKTTSFRKASLCLNPEGNLVESAQFMNTTNKVMASVRYHYMNNFKDGPFLSKLDIDVSVAGNEQYYLTLNNVKSSRHSSHKFSLETQGKKINKFFTDIQPDYWQSLDYSNRDKLIRTKKLYMEMDTLVSTYEQQWDDIQKWDNESREAVANLFFHFGHMLHSNVLVTLENRVQYSDWLPSDSLSGLDVMRRSLHVLDLARQLDPKDRRVHTAYFAARLNEERVRLGFTHLQTLDDLVSYVEDESETAWKSRKDLNFPHFDLMVVLLTIRDINDPNYHYYLKTKTGEWQPNSVMIRLLKVIDRRLQPDSIPGLDEAKDNALVDQLHFVVMTVPLLKTDYFLRYATDAINAKDWANAVIALEEVRASLDTLRNELNLLIKQYPLGDVVLKREKLAAELTKLVRQRKSQVDKQLVDFNRSSFTEPYLCANCHAR